MLLLQELPGDSHWREVDVVAPLFFGEADCHLEQLVHFGFYLFEWMELRGQLLPRLCDEFDDVYARDGAAVVGDAGVGVDGHGGELGLVLARGGIVGHLG